MSYSWETSILIANYYFLLLKTIFGGFHAVIYSILSLILIGYFV